MHKLSIIIPAYNAEPYIEHLINRLKPQIRDDVEVLVVDDGSKFPYLPPYEWVHVIRQDNKGLAGARNTGIENTDGEYIHFVDADDLVPENYVAYILDLIDQESPDYIELSWKSFDEQGGVKFDFKLKPNDTLLNPSACTRIYKRSFLGDMRFNEKKDTAEDEDLFRRMDFSKGKKAVATEYMYFYRTSTPNSLSKRYRRGETHTKRIVYYYRAITADMTWLIDEIKKEFEDNEVVIMAYTNALPELKQYAAVITPQGTYAHEARGEKTNLIKVTAPPIKTQVCIMLQNITAVSGMGTWAYNFVKRLHEKYDILILFDGMDISQISRLAKYVPVRKYSEDFRVTCDTLILNRIWEKIPQNITHQQSIQVIHGCSDVTATTFHVPTDRDKVVFVSETAQESFGEESEGSMVIHNMTYPEKITHPLLLVSATRLDTPEKGQKRMLELANLMKQNGIPFIWLCFSESRIRNAPEEIVFMRPTLDVRSYIARADYLVQLSDSEAFCYSIVEALELGVPVITTPLPVLTELKIRDDKEGYIIPWEISEFDIKKLLKKPKVKWKYDNDILVDQWCELLGNTVPVGDYVPEDNVMVRITSPYSDMYFNRDMHTGEVVAMPDYRATKVVTAGYGVRLEGY